MKACTTVLLLVGLVATALHAEVQPRDIFDEADAALRELEITVADVVATIEQSLSGTEERIMNTGNATNSISKRILQDMQQTFAAEISALEQKGQQGQVDTITCTYGTMREISMLTSALGWNIEYCIITRVQESLLLVEDAYSNLDNARTLVPEFTEKLEECRAAQDTICALTVISQIETQNSLLFIILEGDIQEVLGMIDTIESYFQDCATGPTDTIRLRGRTIVASVTECINNLLEAAQSSNNV